MKKINLIFLMAGIAFLLPVSCVQETVSPEEEMTGRELILDIGVQGMATRAITDSETDLREDYVELLDVFVSGPFTSSGSNEPAWGVKKYHLSKNSDMVEDGKWKVLDDWRTDGYVSGEYYAVYVAANSKRVKNGNVYTQGIGSLDLTGITSEAGLQAALQEAVEYDYDPTASNGQGGTKPFWGAHNDDKLNPEWLDVHKKYLETSTFSTLSSSQNKRFYTDQKSFLMDGVGEFTATPGGDVSSVTLYRAAAKIMLDVTFDPDFLLALGKNPDGQPAWQFVNFAFSTPVFNSSSGWHSVNIDMYDENSIFTAGAIMMGVDSDVNGDLKYGNDYGFTLTTYSYPVAWDAESDVDGAPGIIVSVNYKAANDDTDNFQYYKIPVVAQDVYSLNRNTVYKVSATISSEGGLDLTDAYKVDACNFDIIPWEAATQAKGLDQDSRLYFAASPTDIILRGDGLQSADINIVKPVGTNIGFQYFVMGSATFEEPFKEGSANTRENYTFDSNGIAENAPAPYYFNNVGTRRTQFTKQMKKGDVVYGDVGFIQNKFTRSQGGNKLTLDSYSLPNKGIKYIKVRVYLDVTDWENKKLFRDITIRHYPTSYITSIGGSWSSRKSAGAYLPSTDTYYKAHNDANRGPEEYTTTTQYSFDRRDYNSWDESTNKDIQTGSWPCTWDEYRVLPPAFRNEDVDYEIVPATRAEYNSNNESAYPDPLFERIEDNNYGGYFTANSNPEYPNLLTQTQAGASTRYETEGTAIVSNGYYYWGYCEDGEQPELVGTMDVQSRDTYSSGTTVQPTLANFPFPSSGTPSDYDYYTIGDSRQTDSRSWVVYHWEYYYKATFTFYRYPHHARVNYQKPSYTYNKRYYHTGYGPNTEMLALTGGNWARRKARWVNVGNEYGETGKSGIRTNSFGALQDAEPQGKRSFSARRYVSSGSSISNVSVQNGSNYQVVSSGSGGTNNHMYILRLSETSSHFTMGHPTLDSFNLSKDNVVAPALMVASQLGGFYGDPPAYQYSTNVTSEFYGVRNLFNAQERMWWDARHCATYLEVGTPGVMESSGRQRYYYDWRLPTKAELEMIVNYQGSLNTDTATLDGFSVEGVDRIMEPVLTSKIYRSLDGNSVELKEYNQSGANDVITIRCVRELTLKELELLENL